MKFNKIEINVSKKVFRPRLETEFWSKKAIKEIGKGLTLRSHSAYVLDVFAGTGCIGISILKNIPNAKVDFVDISKQAIKEIKENLKLNGVSSKRYKIYWSDIFNSLEEIVARWQKKSFLGYDFIFANPPYIAINRISEISSEVLKNDPKRALWGGNDGIEIIRRFLREVKKYLKTNGLVFMEFDPLQKPEIERLLKEQGLQVVFHKDQFGKWRWLKAEKLTEC